MELTDNERRAVNDAALIGGNSVDMGGIRVRKISLGSMMQLQRIGSPYGRMGELTFEPGADGKEPSIFEAMGITDQAEVMGHVAEFIWLHGDTPERVQRGVNLPPDIRRDMVEEFMMRFSIADLPKLEEAVFVGMVETQAGMTNPSAEGEGKEDPLGPGRHGVRPC